MALITLSSDIGPQDYLVGAVKGQLLQANPAFTIVDITHQLPPFNYPQAAYTCRNALKQFPPFTFHIVLLNLFDQKASRPLLSFHHDQYILCADNGLLTMILEDRPEMVIGLDNIPATATGTLGFATTFARAINDITAGKRLQDIGEPDTSIVEKNHLRPLLGEDWMEGQIIFIDNFENVVVNITRDQFEAQRKGRRFQISFRRNEHIEQISNSYADVPEGEKLALFNSAGYLEIAVNKGNAAGLFGLQGYNGQSQNAYLQKRLFYQTVKVFFG